MERDFMGLNPVKEEVSDDVNDSAAVTAKANGIQWPFGNKASSVPHLSSHLSAQEDTPNKTASSCFALNIAGILVKSSPSDDSVAALADTQNKYAGSAAPMTIFYNGMVKVYDSITPEKAQAIMFSLGIRLVLSVVTSDACSGTQVRPPKPNSDMSRTDIRQPVSQRVNRQPSSTIASPVSVSSNNLAQSVSSSTSTDELVICKSMLSPFSPDCKMDPPTKPLTALGSAAPATIPRGIPQFRKISLARFLEKRRERVVNAAPYNSAKKHECTS